MKINLVVDLNYLLYKNVFILFKLKTLYTELETLLNNDINNIINAFPYNNIYLLSDHKGHTWRRDIYPEYKMNREKDEKIDWEFVFNTYESFKQGLKLRKNFNVVEVPRLEGDDLIAYAVKESNKKAISNVIVTNDGDIKQLLKYDLNDEYINVIWNYRFTDEIVYLPNNYEIFLSHMCEKEDNDIFNLSNDQDFISYLSTLIERKKVHECNDEESLFSKIISGDKGDNIKSPLLYKNRGIAKDGAANVYRLYKENYSDPVDFYSDTYKNNVWEIVKFYKKIQDDELKETFLKNLNMNIKLIKLDKEFIPSDLLEEMRSNFTFEEKNNDNFWE